MLDRSTMLGVILLTALAFSATGCERTTGPSGAAPPSFETAQGTCGAGTCR